MERLTIGPDAIADVEEFIYAMVVWGEHHYDKARTWSPDQMRTEIPEFEQVVEEVRRGEPVRHFENLLQTNWQTSAPSGHVGVRNPATGEEINVPGEGTIELSGYVSRFETATGAWRRSVAQASHPELLSAITTGMAAIEGYVNSKAIAWNAQHPDDQLIDSAKRRMSFRRKIEEWVPKLSGGGGLKRDTLFWSDLFEIKKYRDEAVHLKQTVGGVTLGELARLLNLFTSGLAIPLFQLHVVFKQAIPSAIIRAAYAPEVRVSNEDAAA